jgi:ribosomal protein S18 acetylase RimI-like enzyme/SAM-dependent methyltransferase
MTTSIHTYDPSYRQHFIDLNTAWLNEFFEVEEHDRQVFNKIEESIIRPGGEIFFCLEDGAVVGTVAMQKMAEGIYELAKMAIAKPFRGRGFSNSLMSACIEFATKKKASKIVLVSNTGMIPAIRLYHKFGFVEVPLDETDYARADIQMELSLVDESPWDRIPLSDYERHMSHEQVGQLKMLSKLTQTYLDELKPEKALFVGIAGGNGLEHIDPQVTKSVIGVDISQQYLSEGYRRFGERIQGLRLLKLDITQRRPTLIRGDMVWAALVMEFTGIDNALEFALNNLRPGGSLVATIQCNNGIAAVSPTGVTSIQNASEIFRTVEEEDLIRAAKGRGFVVTRRQENFLPNGKSFRTFLLTT